MCKCIWLYSMLLASTSVVKKYYVSWVNHFEGSNQRWKQFETSKQLRSSQQKQMVFFHHSCFSSQCEISEKIIWIAVWTVGYSTLDGSCNVWWQNCSQHGSWNKGKTTQEQSFSFTDKIHLNQFCVNHWRIFANSFANNFWLLRSLVFQRQPKSLANVVSKIVCRFRTEKCQIRFYICKVKLSFLRSSISFDSHYFFRCDFV